MMRPPMVLLYFLLIMSEGLAVSNRPRRSVSFQGKFKESGFGSLSSLMIRDDIGQLVVGARGKVLTLSLDDITEKTSEVRLFSADKALCQMKGKHTKECDNFIRTLHTMEDGKMLVCGTNAFNPECDYMVSHYFEVCRDNTFCTKTKPLFPFHLTENTLYSAASSNFLSTELVFQRHGLNPLKTEMIRSWFNGYLAEVSKNSEDSEDDNVFLFFTETAVEERHDNIQVSRIARVCKSDLGGERTLQRKWTSFLKARLDCPFGGAGLSSLVQDAFLLQDPNNWRDSIFYATFTANSKSFLQSAVCAYKLSDISQVFSGRFLTEMDTGSWETYTGEEPFPHPGSCINDELRAKGVMSSLDLSDKALLFVKSHPLMEGVVTPIAGKPLLVRTGIRFSKIVVDQVTSLDGRRHQVMLIGTDSGWLQKAVRFDGEGGRVIEELQLFQTPQPVNFLQLSFRTGQLYSGANNIAVQVNIRDCSRYTSCDDCLLARDPYCGWDKFRAQINFVLIQSLTDGDIQMCPISECELNIHTCSYSPRDVILLTGPRHTVLSQGLIIRPSNSDSGIYTCETVETVKGKVHRKTVVQYFVEVQDTNTLFRTMRVAVIILADLACLLMLLICSALVIRHLKAKKQNHIGCANQNNNNNNQMIIVRPFYHYDQTLDRHMEEGLVNCDQAGEQSVETGNVISILVLPGCPVAKVAEEELEADNDNRCTFIETTG
uniref:Si:ch211-129c21.1 n=1 Tax=Sander lucioperca TaxID=283035 RepID=A0A8C9XDY4_SANLU